MTQKSVTLHIDERQAQLLVSSLLRTESYWQMKAVEHEKSGDKEVPVVAYRFRDEARQLRGHIESLKRTSNEEPYHAMFRIWQARDAAGTTAP